MEKSTNPNDSSFYTVLLDTLPQAITMVNCEGIVQGWNKAAAQIYNIPPQEILGSRIGDFFQRGSLMLFQVMDSGLPVYGVYHQPLPNKHVFIDTMPVFNALGELIGAVSIERDITDVVKLSEERYNQQVDHRDLNSSPVFQSSHGELRTTLRFLEQLRKVDPMPALLIKGESGVGKSTLARYIHQLSHPKGPFLSVACQAFPDGYLDIELFGHQGHTFGDARDEKIGKLALAGQGTLYLSHIDVMPSRTQMKLAKVIQDRGFTKNGGSQWIPLTCQIITSTTCETPGLEGNSQLLPELFFQFHPIDVPPLRQRRDDLPALCHYYLHLTAERLGKPIPQLCSEVMAAITTHTWPGNIPELVRVMERLVIVSGEGPLTLDDIPSTLRPKTLNEITEQALPLSSISQDTERRKIEEILAQTGGNKSLAARRLGISRGTLYYKLRQYDIK